MRKLYILLFLGFLLLAGIGSAAVNLTVGNISIYPFVNASDALGRINGSVTNAVTSTGCKNGDCFVYDGTADYITFSAFGVNWNATNWTVSTWANYTGSNDAVFRGIIGNRLGYGQSNSKWWLFGKSDGNNLILEVAGVDFDSGVAIGTTKQWHLYTIVKGGSNYTVYLDGSPIISTISTANAGDATNDLITALWASTAQDWTGKIDELYIWNRNLNATEIQNLTTAFYPFSTPAPPPPDTSSASFFILANNEYNSTLQTNFNATVDGTTYGTTTGAINVTAFLMNSTALHNITVFKANYLNKSYSNYNVSVNLTAQIYQAEVNITTFDLFSNQAITSYNLTLGTAKNITTDGKASIHIDAGAWVLYASASDYDLNTTTVSAAASSQQSANISLFKHLYVFAKNNLNNQNIQNFTVTLLGLNYTRTEINTSSQNKSYFKTGTESVNITISAPGFAPNSAIVALSSLETNYSFNLYTTNSFNITFKNEATLAVINTTTVYLDLISDAYANNYSTSNGTAYIDALTPTTYTFRYYGSGFSPRLSTFTLTNNTYSEITLLLLPGGQNVTLFVFDEKNAPLENATIKIYRYSTASNSYILVNTIATDFEGKAITNLQTNAEFYRFYIYYGGDLKLATSPAYVSSDQLIFTISTSGALLDNYFKTTNEYTYSFTYLRDSATFRFFYDTNGEASQGCVNLYKVGDLGEKTYLSQTCQNAATATLLKVSPNITDTSYYAEGVIVVDGETRPLAVLMWFEKSNGLNNSFGLFLTFILMAVFAMLGLSNLSAALVLTPLALVLAAYLGFIAIPVSSAFAVEVVGVVLALVISRGD